MLDSFFKAHPVAFWLFWVTLSVAPVAAAPAISNQVPPGTALTIGDPETQQALLLSGESKNLPFRASWANISGGPDTIQAFRARALDLGAVGEIPPIHANWTGVPVKIVAVHFRQDAINHPVHTLGIAPGAGIKSLADLRGKRIAYSPGQAQGILVLRILRKVGLSKNDVRLIELPANTGDVYVNALAGRMVDAAPINIAPMLHYLANYGRDGARVIPHGLRDDIEFLYAPVAVLNDPAKSAAIRAYVKFWARAQRWIDTHPDQWSAGYYVKLQGLSPADGHYLAEEAGHPDIPASWDNVIRQQQDTIDLLARETGQPRLDAADEFDRRYEMVAAVALAGK